MAESVLGLGEGFAVSFCPVDTVPSVLGWDK